MIERLVLKDFKSHEDSDIKFYPSLNVFLGEVGAGKTSVLEAISFALFGRYAGNVTKNQLIRRGAEKAEVSLIFSTSSGRYKTDRTIHSKKRQKAKLWVFEENDWKLAVDGATAVSNSIEDILDVDSSTFLVAIYASQSEIKEMLETQPGKRRERLDKLLGLDMYEKIWETLGDARNLVLNELTEAQNNASGFNLLEKQITNLKGRLEKNSVELKMLKSFLKEIKDRLQPEEQQLKAFEDLKRRLDQLQTQTEDKKNEIQNSSATLKSINEKIEKASEAEKVYKKNKRFIQQEKDLEEEKRRVETSLQQKKMLETLLKRDNKALQEALKRQIKLKIQVQHLKILEERLRALEKEKVNLHELNRKEIELQKKLDKLKEEAVRAYSEIEGQERRVERVAELGECPTCLQIVPEEHKDKIKKEIGGAVAKLKTDYATIEEARTNVQNLLGDLKKRIEHALKVDKKHGEVLAQIKMLKGCRKENEEVSNRIEEAKSRVEECREKTAEIKETPETLVKVTKELRKVTSKAELAKEAEIHMAAKKDLEAMFLQETGKLEELKLQLIEMQSSMNEILEEYNPEEHGKAESNVRVLREDQAKTNEGAERLEKSMKEDASQIKQAETQLIEKRKAWEQVETLRIENKVLEVLRKSLREVVQPIMRRNNVLNVSQAFHTFYQELSNENIDYAALDEEGNVEVTRNGEPSPVNSLSGGETTCAALALRLAICSSLTKNQLLLLDEPTIHLDESYRAKLRVFLSNHNFEQLIVVTHDATFDSLPAHIFKVEKQRNRSIITPLNLTGET